MKRILIAMALLCAALICGCSSGKPLLLSTALEGNLSQDDTRRYTLIYFFGVSAFDPRRAVFLDYDADEITLLPNVRDFEYEKLQNVSMREALYETDVFFASEPKIINSTVNTITTPEGHFVGYEILPLYDPDYLGRTDLLDVFYSQGPDDQTLIDVRLKRGVPKNY